MIYVATHDPTGNTRYYLWDFVETYQHNAFYYARYKVVNSTIVERPAGEQNYYCWSIINSTNIFLGSTKKFSEDRINFPIMFIPKGSIKVSIKYTLFVRQQALTEESFLYWQQLQKTTENIGGLFDPLPSRVVGNVHNVADSTEPVMGYITGGSITSQRFWISTTQLPTDQQAAYSFGGCYTVPIEGFLASYNGDLVVDIAPPSVSFGHCVDCLIDGGSLIKPPYWP